MTAKLKGIVFDMDGVIIESEFTHYSAICEAMGERMNQSYETFLTKCTGGDERFAMGRLAELCEIDYDEQQFQQWSQRKAEAYKRLVSQEAKAMPGAVDLVLSAAEHFPIALATGSRKVDVDAALEVLAGGVLKGIFQVIVSSSDVKKPKPHPATYEMAMEGIGLPAENCIAIEDSPNGVASAKQAGLRVLGVSVMHGRDALQEANWCTDSLEKISVGELIRLFQS
jgi:beta-phosphoglucomutase